MIELHIVANLFYPVLPGGSLQYFRYAPYLLERGVRTVVHSPLRPEHEDVRKLEIEGIEINRLDVPSHLSLLDELMFLSDAAQDRIRRSSVEKACIQPIGTMGGSWARTKQLWSIRRNGIALTRHFTQVPNPRNFRLKERIRFWTELSPFHRLLMCSHEMGRAYCRTTGVSPKRVEVIANGIDLEIFRQPQKGEKEALREKLNLPVGVPLVIYTGSIIPRKGVDYLVEAWERVISKIPEARFVVVGSNTVRPTVKDPDERARLASFLEKFEKSVAALSQPGSVIVTGEVDNVEEYYRCADVFAFASLQEGLPSAVLESMASGVPAVLAPFNGFPGDGEEYGTPGEHFLKSDHSPESLASDLLRLIQDGDLREKMGEAAARWIEQTQAMPKAVDRLAEVYHEIFARRKR